MHEYICMGKGVEREIAGTIAGIAVDEDIETGGPEYSGILRCPPFKSCGKLEGDLPCPPQF